MKSLTLAAFMALASVSLAHAECFTTSRAVFQAHPERSTWATWRTIDHRHCWYAKGQTPGWEIPQNTASVLDRPRSRSNITLDTPQVAGASRTHKAAVPLPKPNPRTASLMDSAVAFAQEALCRHDPEDSVNRPWCFDELFKGEPRQVAPDYALETGMFFKAKAYHMLDRTLNH